MGRLGAVLAAPAALFISLALAGPAFAKSPSQSQGAAEAATRGEYIFNAAGCLGCHTDEKKPEAKLAGGRALKTPFGTFYGPNITSDPVHGIGRWTEADFIQALRAGVRPGGSHLFPVFPFTSFTKMSDADMRDLWAYLRTVPAVATPSPPHEVGFPFNLRFLQMGWKWLNFTSGAFRPDPMKSAQINRGAYLVEALGHCGECHTPRNAMGGLDRANAYAGAKVGPEGGRIPNITPDRETGVGQWSDADFTDLLVSGMTRDGDSVGGAMGEVVKNTTSKLTEDDVKAVIAYLKSLPPIRNETRTRKPE